MTAGPAPRTPRVARVVWLIAGLVAVGFGGLGIVVPGLPTTVFFIIAAGCFSKGSPRLEQWVLDLPTIGPMVRDHRAGLGMPRRAKVIAIAMIVVVITISVVLAIDAPVIRAVVVVAGVIGVGMILFAVPTHERVLAARDVGHLR